MPRRAPLLTAFLLALAVGACAPDPERMAPPVEARHVATEPGRDGARLLRGRQIYLGACTECHHPRMVAHYDSARWENLVSAMADSSRLTGDERDAVRAYVLAIVREAPRP